VEVSSTTTTTDNSSPQKKTVVFDENVSEKSHPDGSTVLENDDGAARMFVKAQFDFPSENNRELELKKEILWRF